MFKKIAALLIVFTLLLSLTPAVYAGEADFESAGSTEKSFFSFPFFMKFFTKPAVSQPNDDPAACPTVPCIPLPCIPCIPVLPPCPPPPPPPCGSLTVTKTLVAPAGFDMGKQFDFCLRNAFNAVVGTATIGDGGSATFSNLMPGKYTITEAAADVADYDLTVAVTGAAAANGGCVIICAGAQTAAFTNTYVKHTGDLTITKTLVAPAGFNMGKLFTITVRDAANAVVGTAVLANGGSQTFTLDVGTYTVTEDAAAVATYDWDVAVTGAAASNGGTVTVAVGSQSVDFTNTYVKQTGDLIITKTLCAPKFFNKCKVFNFTVCDANNAVAATAALKGGESTTIYGLEVGTYTITESNAAVCGYTLTVGVSGAATSNGGSLTIAQGTQEVVFNNVYQYKTIPLCTIKIPCFIPCFPACPSEPNQPE